ncbi:MAG: ABC transporter permease [Gammaproteobacteria bacterium]|nr:ABC transporter permease [Gammaproteobacteria bacterium]MDE0253018.1 ABC transporter permease [Gammaproteobacteria bacterium]MDE0402338.1 ABC transporter permease [Gammaproteobacteria bacterium]
MSLKLAVAIGWRYVRSSRDFLKSVALLAMLGLALSVAILLVVQAVVAGFEYELKNRVLGVMPHLEITSFRDNGVNVDVIESVHEHLTADFEWAVEVETLALVAPLAAAGNATSSSHQVVEPMRLNGIDPVQYSRVSTVFQYIENAETSQELRAESFTIYLGRTLANRLGVEVGDSVVVWLTNSTLSLVGFLPRQKRFKVGGIVDTSTIFDSGSAYTHIEDARRLLRLNDTVSSIQLKLDDPFLAPNVASALNFNLEEPSLYVLSWTNRHGYLYRSIQESKYILIFIFSLLVAVAAFNLVSTVVVFVRERVRDIAVYRTLGSTRTFIGVIFLTTAVLISVLGLILGCIGGWLIGLILEAALPMINSLLGTDLLAEYFVSTLTVHFQITDVITVCLLGLGLALLASLLPAYSATRTDPAEVLRYE